MSELLQLLGHQLVELERDIIAPNGWDLGFAIWSMCPDDEEPPNFHLHKLFGSGYDKDIDPEMVLRTMAEHRPLPGHVLGIIFCYESWQDVNHTIDVRVVVGCLRDGTALMLTHIRDCKPRLEIAPSYRGTYGPGARFIEAARALCTTSAEHPLAELLRHLPPGTVVLGLPEDFMEGNQS